MNKYITIVENDNTLNAIYCDGKEMFSETIKTKKEFPNAAQAVLQKVTGLNNTVSTKTAEPLAKPKPPKHEYKVGEKVTIVQNTTCHNFRVGERAILIKWNDNGNYSYWDIKSTETGVTRCAYEVDFEPYTEPKPEPETVKLYNGKVVCVSADYDNFTVGKVYEYKDGLIMSDFSLDPKNRWYGHPYNEHSQKATDKESINLHGFKFVEYKGEA